MDLFNHAVHVDDKGSMDGLRRGDAKCSGPEAKNDDSWISNWEELHGIHPERIPVEVEHVKAHHSKKEKQQMSLFEHFITEGNRKADEPAKDGTMMGGRAMAQNRTNAVSQEKRGCVRRVATCSKFSLSGGRMVRL